LNNMLSLFADNLLPILITAGAGYILQRTLGVDPKPLARVTFYLFTPALAFSIALSTSITASDIIHMTCFGFAVAILMSLLSWALSRFLRLPQQVASVFILTATFMNAGNYGLPLNDFFFGEEGLALASVFFITNALLTNSLGVFITTAGRQPLSRALVGLLKIPAVYAIPLAVLVRTVHWQLPVSIERPISLLGSAMIPSMLILLGMQISHGGLPKRKDLLALVVGLRLIISPLLAFLIAPLFGLRGLSAHVGILESAMPTAVLATVIATEFDVEPDFATGAVLITTLLSPLTVAPLLALIRG
jgi:predicted permease